MSRQRSSSAVIALLCLVACLPDPGDPERADHPEARESPPPSRPLDPPEAEVVRPYRLATEPLLVPAGEFTDELESLAVRVAAKIRWLHEVRTPDGSLDTAQLAEVFRVATFWPRPEFVEPLLFPLRRRPDFRWEAAAALLRYSDPTLREAVEAYRDHDWTERSGCVQEEYSVAALLGSDPPAPSLERGFVDASPGLLPHRAVPAPWVELWPRRPASSGVTLPIAVAALDDPSLSVRLQAWIWLAELGLIAPTDSVEEAWPSLTDLERTQRIPGFWRVHVGADRVRQLGDTLVLRQGEEPSAEVEGRLFTSLANLASPAVRSRMRQVIATSLVRSSSSERDDVQSDDPRLRGAVHGLAHAVSFEDFDVWRDLATRGDVSTRGQAWAAIARMDQSAALESLREALLTADLGVLWHGAWVLEELGRRGTPLREEYLGILARALEVRAPGASDEWWMSSSFPQLINAFESLAGQDFGDSGLRLPGGFDAAAARATAARCVAWQRARRESGRAEESRGASGASGSPARSSGR